jgi:hypothetical protein
MNEELRPVLRAAAIAAFVVGLLLMFLRPPSLSGAGGLAALVGVCIAFLVVVAWATVALIGSDGVSEEDFERIVRRSEELARRPSSGAEGGDFEQLVANAIDRLPPEFRALLEDTPFVI